MDANEGIGKYVELILFYRWQSSGTVIWAAQNIAIADNVNNL